MEEVIDGEEDDEDEAGKLGLITDFSLPSILW